MDLGGGSTDQMMFFEQAIGRLRTRLRDLELDHAIFPNNRQFVRNVSIESIKGGQGTARFGVLGASKTAVVVKSFDQRAVYQREFLDHVEVFMRLYGRIGQPRPVHPIISTPIYLGLENRLNAAQTLLPGARDFVAYQDEEHAFDDTVRLGPLLHAALAELNEHGIIHGDISPDNIVVYQPPQEAHARIALIDFGMSTLLDDRPLSMEDLKLAAQKRYYITTRTTRLFSPRCDYMWMYVSNNAFDRYYAEQMALMENDQQFQHEYDIIRYVRCVRALVGWNPHVFGQSRTNRVGNKRGLDGDSDAQHGSKASRTAKHARAS